MSNLSGKICVVTGASRGIGRAISLELATAGATVYATARSLKQTEDVSGTVETLAAAAQGLAGRIVPVACDHSVNEQVAVLFERVRTEHGRLDLLVNNMYPTDMVIDWPGSLVPGGRPFWEIPADVWSTAMDLGIRTHCLTTALAVPCLIESKGLIINISSGGGAVYYASVPYGITKGAIERLTRDAAVELDDYGVTIVSLWPGWVKTEVQDALLASHPDASIALLKDTRLARERAWNANGSKCPLPETALDGDEITLDLVKEATETAAFTGQAIIAIMMDKQRHEKTGRSLSVVGVAREYGFTDSGNRLPDAFGYLDAGVWPLLAH